jgi:mRNA degradation ribonuclease J1/J2
MKAYEFSAKITSDGKLEVPDLHLEDLPRNSVARVIVLVEESTDAENEDDDDDSVEEISASLRRALREAKTGQRILLSQLWEGIDTSAD